MPLDSNNLNDVQIDNRVAVTLPEGIDIQAEVAGPVVRGLALALDFMLRGVIIGVIAIVLILALGADIAGGFLLISWFVLEWFYPVIFEVLRHGQTPGKKAFGLVVVNDDLTPIRFEASVIRNLLRAADFLPAGFMFGLTAMALSKDFKRLGDLAAGTLVVYQHNGVKARGRNHAAPAKLAVGPAYPLPQYLSQAEQTALVSYLTRAPGFSHARLDELADILTPLHQKHGEDARLRLLGYARTLLGYAEEASSKEPEKPVSAIEQEAAS